MYLNRALLPLTLVTFALVLSGCQTSSLKEPYLNSGSPKAPVNLQTPWWQRGETTSTPLVSFDQFAGIAQRGGMRVRVDARGRMTAPRVALPYPATLTSGKEVMGWCVRYKDRMELTAIPSDQPLDLEATLSTPVTPNSRGESLIYKPSTVRGKKALVAEAGDQLWESGESSHYPAIVEWQEDSGVSEYPYITYVMRADMPASALRGLAEGLAHASAD